MRSHAGLNLLFCLHTLATSSSSVSSEAFIARSMKAFSVEDYHCLSRFNCELCLNMVSYICVPLFNNSSGWWMGLFSWLC